MQVIVSCTRAAQLVAPYVPFPLPPMVTFAAVGATPCPVHDNTAVIVIGESAPDSSEPGSRWSRQSWSRSRLLQLGSPSRKLRCGCCHPSKTQ